MICRRTMAFCKLLVTDKQVAILLVEVVEGFVVF